MKTNKIDEKFQKLLKDVCGKDKILKAELNIFAENKDINDTYNISVSIMDKEIKDIQDIKGKLYITKV